jgi:GAF domain
VWASGELAWIPDVPTDPNFARGPAAAGAGLRSALAFLPLLAGGVVGVVEFLSRDLRAPDAALTTTLAAIGSHRGL